ncbi:hypothetical protein DKG82_11165 [Salmonella enterica subsp. enterica serovar Lexington]|nr:hypothetical protein [Salmonella enterica subsp. enterica serovar Lexington]EAA7886421.1 hypothetical protein [Salmonella enterica]ECC3314091.1 hypothetical protein [Salmonella enterica subsp. enterica]EAA7872873.1 hypothetical protein [Salmonella enterica subsp. enterica serovar Lexington]EAM2792651.1 hypothetical protein [Salmonella enterica]
MSSRRRPLSDLHHISWPLTLQFIPYLRITSTSVRSFHRRVTNTDLYQKALPPASILSAPRPSLGVL